MIHRNTTDAIREIPIRDVVEKYYSGLKPSGSTFKGKSPFTTDKTPSFFVHPAKGFFKCFSSGKGGDAITFVMEHEKLNYVDAVKQICKEFNISFEDDAPAADPKEVERIEALYTINRAAANKFVEQLTNKRATCKPLQDEIAKRQFTDETLVQWQIGYAPDEWKFLTEKLISTGNYQHGFDLGLIKTKNESNYDAFRHRLIFPIEDERGRIVAFGGRHLNDAQVCVSTGDVIKYINSPESPIYHKSKVLYGLYQAIPHIREAGHVKLTEGYTDVISMHQANFGNTVGTCGTALTDEQVTLLKRYTLKAEIWYDPDKAGHTASLRAIDMFLAQGFEVQIVPLPDGKDPDDFVRMFNQVTV